MKKRVSEFCIMISSVKGALKIVQAIFLSMQYRFSLSQIKVALPRHQHGP